MFSTRETHKLKRVLIAIAAHRIETIIRVCADHVFADPALIGSLAVFHNSREKAAYSYFENVPAWAGAEVIGLDSLQRAFDSVRLQGGVSVDPGEFFRSNSETFDCRGFKAQIKGRLSTREFSLVKPESAAAAISAVRKAPDPAAVSVFDLPA
jgi:spore coat polysaccharide biosynthesis protein SpsF (cytidylyltransferase family)